jgi:hypothetical protein
MSNTATFSGLPHCTDFYTTADIAIIGIPHGTPYDPDQASHSADAPAVIRQASAKYAHMLEHYDFDFGGTLLNEGKADVVDCGECTGARRFVILVDGGSASRLGPKGRHSRHRSGRVLSGKRY